ncbi:hypothetical protein C8R44DRAFT_872422 [Mycena epipterygia]|nr:hypothetical protein C8R44DRAFT_872422 [Mycena epipterygia]
MASLPSQEPTRQIPPRAAPEAGKDEFGRDIRPASPSPVPTPPPALSNRIPTPPPPAAPTVPRTQTVEPPPAALTSNHDQMSLTPSIDANTSSRAPDAAVVSNKIPSQPGMENFSLATFDFTAPSSWEALGKMWQVTHGYLPSTEQLMEFVMTGGAAVVASQQPQPQQLHQPEWNGGWGGMPTAPQPRRGARGRGGFSRGRGGGGYGARDGQHGWHSDMGETDAIVLGGGDVDAMMEEPASSPEKGGGLGGRMQRVGEKWVFVRDPVTNES